MMTRKTSAFIAFALLLFNLVGMPLAAKEKDDQKTLRVFIFAGQSNMVGSDSKVQDIKRFPHLSAWIRSRRG